MYGQHTLGHLNCDACRSLMNTEDFAVLTFAESSQLWIKQRERYVSPRTLRDYKQYVAALNPFFGQLPLRHIHSGHLRQFQAERSASAGAIRVNHELGALQQIMRRAGLWASIEPHYENLPMPKPKTGKAISPDEEDRLFRVASKNGRWKVAYWASSLTANTTAGPGEIRHLRVGDIDLQQRLLFIREGTKNEFRVRRIPLNDRAHKMVWRLMERAQRIAAKQKEELLAECYLLPHLKKNGREGYDFKVPMFSWRCAWNSLRKAAGLPALRLYDLRHHAITRLLENPDVSEETVKSIAGHVSKRILETYSHIRLKAKEDALRALEAPRGRLDAKRVPDWYFYQGEKKA